MDFRSSKLKLFLSELEHLFYADTTLSLSELMSPDFWPKANELGQPIMAKFSRVTLYAHDGAADVWVSDHDDFKRPILKFYLTAPRRGRPPAGSGEE